MAISTQEAVDTITPVATDFATATPERIRIVWYLCFGVGTDPVSVAAEWAAANDFNKLQERIELVLDIDPYGCGSDQLATMIAYGDAPDIVDFQNWSGLSRFQDEWLDLAPLIEAANFDLSQFNPRLIELAGTQEGQFALPLGVYPSALFFNKQLFDSAGLEYPPAAYGEKYVLPDGSEVEWSWETLGNVARRLTLDSGGRNITETDFEKENNVQYGYTWQYENHPNYWGSYWAGGSLLAPGGSVGQYKAQVPDAWRAAWRWTYDAIWGDRPFMGTAAEEGSQDYAGGNPFDSGKVAMTVQPYWYTCCMSDVKTWEMAAMPSWNGKVGGLIDGISFHIWKGTKHPREAFEVLAYLVQTGVQKLVNGYEDWGPAIGEMPAKTAYQEAWMETQRVKFPWVENWDCLLAGLDYPDMPKAEGYMPNYNDAWMRGDAFANLLRSTDGLDLDREIEKYMSDLTEMFNA